MEIIKRVLFFVNSNAIDLRQSAPLTNLKSVR